MYNHFHAPYRDSGLDDFLTGESTLWWAQDTVEQSNDTLQGDQSWATLRQLYYDALTAGNETDHSAKFAQLFKGLGHQMQMLQDMTVPSHVRNDSHAVESFLGVTRLGQTFFYILGKKNRPLINLFASDHAIFPTLTYGRPMLMADRLINDR